MRTRPVQASEKYRLFLSSSFERMGVDLLADGYKGEYLHWGSFATRRLTSNLRSWILRWKLLCIARCVWTGPSVYVTWIHGELAHYAFVLPSIGRLDGMGANDLEIGPCWTAPQFRRRGLFCHAIHQISHDFWESGRNFWMIVRNDNTASARVILKAGFVESADCRRVAHLSLPLHTYQVVEARKHPQLRVIGVNAAPPLLRRAYVDFHDSIRAHVHAGQRVADICGGSGVHAFTAAQIGAEVYSVSVWERDLKVVRNRAALLGLPVRTLRALPECLPFPDESLDMVMCSGGLSELDPERFAREVRRVLRPGGQLLLIDSFHGHLRRGIAHYWACLVGRRAFGTAWRGPDRNLLRQLQAEIGPLRIRHYGVGILLGPLLHACLGETEAIRVLSWIDRRLRNSTRFAACHLVVAEKPMPARNPVAA